MAKDLLYYYDKTTFQEKEFGEIQTGFDASFVIDGTKDSMKVVIYSFVGKEIEPYTIIQHKSTNTWWVVSNDQVKTINNEDNEYLYEHTIQLLGAVELLNARDLTDCGFNTNRYTIGQVLNRLLKLSSWEMVKNEDIDIEWHTNDYVNLEEKVDYTKTFENYTLLSALREFMDGYNCDVKLSFTTGVKSNKKYIVSAIIDLLPKSGFLGSHTHIDFNDTRELRTMNKDSYGATVMSNAENVISTKVKIYPSVGTIRLSATDFNINYGDYSTDGNAVLRLPTNAYKVNKVTMISPMILRASVYFPDDTQDIYEAYSKKPIDVSAKQQLQSDILTSINALISFIRDKVDQNEYDITSIIPELEDLYDKYESDFDNIYLSLWEQCSVTATDGFDYNPTQSSEDGENVIVENKHFDTASDFNDTYKFLLTDKEQRNNMIKPRETMYWERGSNLIRGFEFLDIFRWLTSNKTQVNKAPFLIYYKDVEDTGGSTHHVRIALGNILNDTPYNLIDNENIWLDKLKTTFRVEYIPMGDIKVKYDNTRYARDLQVYNQNGKLTDSVALSKLLLSYSKEIEGDTITRYKHFYDYNEVPQVGEIVVVDNKYYVISHISLSFYQNEDDTYFIDGEFTLSPNIAVKSLITSPNSNIRDYGIPQNNNVSRKEVYRDFYELDYDIDKDNYYNALTDANLKFDKVVNLSPTYKDLVEHTCVIKITYNEVMNGKDTYYYQKPSTTYMLKKEIYEVVDLQDNNIIGYGSQNVWCGFVLDRILTGTTDTINTPISYVDSKGEFIGIEMAMCNDEQITEIYDSYLATEGQTYDGSLWNYSVFVPQDIYEGASTAHVTASSAYTGYYKDSTNTGDFNFDIDPSTGYIIIDLDLDQAPTDLIRWQESSSYFTEVGIDALSQMYIYGSVLPIPLLNYTHFVYFDSETRKARIMINKDVRQYNLLQITLYLKLFASQRHYTAQGAKQKNDYRVIDSEYAKDATEVPVFEFSCQIDNTDNVVVGDNILDRNENDFCYFYVGKLVAKGSNPNAIFTGSEIVVEEGTGESQVYPFQPLKNNYYISNQNDLCCMLKITNKVVGSSPNLYTVYIVKLYFFDSVQYSGGAIEYGNYYTEQEIKAFDWENYDLAIGRYSLNTNNNMNQEHWQERGIIGDLIFSLKDVPNSNIKSDTTGGYIELVVNYYKEK